ncbi:MAG: MarR family transcriptional regulator [Kordiimonadaceae bacterium]|nr:MarR family transcriptional regulator [Kordiimonadaceae bacterium]
MTEIDEKQLANIRSSSRRLVRELGFLNSTLADTRYSASAVHAIIEIGASEGGITAKELSEILMLEKSSVSRLIKNLIKTGEVAEFKAVEDARQKDIKLTDQGKQTLTEINGFARKKVEGALSPLNPYSRSVIEQGLQIYSDALDNRRVSADGPIIEEGYTPGLIGGIAALHGTLYQDIVDFGVTFEAKVATGLAEFMPRIGRPQNNSWFVREGKRIAAGITIDGEDLGNNIAHLRWFIVDKSLQSSGVGRGMLAKAIEFCEEQRFRQIDLWTFKGLDAARSLYERNGFKLVDEYPDNHWGAEVLEQKFVKLL